MSIFNLFIHVLQVPLGHWKKCVEKVEEKILCTGSGENICMNEKKSFNYYSVIIFYIYINNSINNI